MKVTPKLKKELAQWLDTYWTTYLKGDIETWSTFISDDYRNIGGTKEEIWNSKQEIIDYSHRILDQMVGTAEIRNREIEVIPYGEYIMVNEFTDLYVKIDNEWELYGPFRMSSLLGKTDTGWIALHQHGSYPDMKAIEGEAFSIDALKAENTRLTKAVKDRTVELEEKNRELEIEAALERVRTVAMGMSKQEDLLNISKIQFNELKQLGFTEIRNALIGIFHDDKNYFADYYYSDFSGGSITNIPYNKNPVIDRSLKQMKSATDAFTEFIVEGNELEEWKAFRKQNGEYDDARITNVLYYYFYSIEQGNVGISAFKKISEEQLYILKKFRNVFDLAYKRYVDITNAEAQAREAQIEAALEKVRSRSLAVHKTEEFKDVVKIVFEKLQELGIETEAASININIEGSKDIDVYIGGHSNDGLDIRNFRLLYFDDIISNDRYNAQQSGIDFFSKTYGKEEKDAFFKYQFEFSEMKNVPDDVRAIIFNSDQYTFSMAFGKHSITMVNNFEGKLLSAHEVDVLKRFSKVFEQAYVRFLDLQKAEAQAREGQIQLALERVRAKTMAMQHSEDLYEVIREVNTQLQQLNFRFDSADFLTDYSEKGYKLWVASVQEAISQQLYITASDNKIPRLLKEAMEEGKDFFTFTLNREEKNKYFDHVFETPVAKNASAEAKQFIYGAAGMAVSCFVVKNIILSIANFACIPYKDTENEIIRRFAFVFEQSYTRFLDLQKAEAQARESQIEAALERVRSIAMSMMKSEDLGKICEAVYKQLIHLGFEELRAAQIYISNDAEEKFLNYNYAEDNGADLVEVKYNSHPNTRRIYDVIKIAGDGLVHNIISKEELNAWKHYLHNTLRQPREKGLDKSDELHYYLYSFGIGAFGISTYKKIKEEELQILKRFRNVFSLSYQRYTDIAQAEAQAKEARIETALERVRSRTLAMQNSDELAETSAVLFKQLIGLGILPNRLYISIVKDDAGNTEFWITDEDGSKVSMAYEDNLNNNPSFKKMYDGWKQQKKSLVIDMKGKELKEYLQHLTSIHVPFKGGLTQKIRWQYVAYFSKGFIGMASPDEQPAETIQLLERFAYVFNLTFTRFNDLQIAEAHALQAESDLIEIKNARQRAEAALNELQATQKQLIQSEKMASLGELTAGIAHEIQNPLNFVNNFSEVNKEMLEELKAERLKPNAERDNTLEDELINDVIENSEKINHHGKRAGDIVKGMLQHSQTSAGVKEPTDINALADEYLRLSYHGLRAKDKSFNVTMKTDFDENIQKINIIPQDIGRVLLNLFNNAFYAVSEKLRQAQPDSHYEPTVSVRTFLNPSLEGREARVIITVSDNGNGIPKNIIDKIFQPFFTTKPTGSGTGLGLSLSYDIVKVHGGEIKIESKEGEGSEFIIQLPVV